MYIVTHHLLFHFRLLVCGLLILPFLISKIISDEEIVALTMKVSPQMYFLQPGQQHLRTRHTSLLILNDTGEKNGINNVNVGIYNTVHCKCPVDFFLSKKHTKPVQSRRVYSCTKS